MKKRRILHRLVSLRKETGVLLLFLLIFELDAVVFPHTSLAAMYALPLLLASRLASEIMVAGLLMMAIVYGIVFDPYVHTGQEILVRYSMMSAVYAAVIVAGYKMKKNAARWEKEKSRLEELNSQLAQVTEDVTMALVEAIEAKDKYLEGHSRKVAHLARWVARFMKLRPEEIDNVYWAALLHDIGKIGVPESILNKTDRLTASEWYQVQQHPIIGAEILSRVPSLQAVVPSVLHHHERYDGKGYPKRLKGTEIPLGARIIAVVDAFEAMTSDRSYRKGMSNEKAIEELKRCAGTQFDPRIVEAFIKCFMERGEDQVERSLKVV
ncbi:HD-GYP domain-containing protein [Calderihabitans maritimus]|nr:HD-GYP domain-containing protein [Calderihabitans maritimus]